MVCEMCNSNDIQKQDGVYVCQSCGTKYSVEEAKKLFVEGTVDVSGSTVKVDNSAFVEKYLSNARRAYEKEDWEEVEKYYNLVEQNDSSNIEAIFYSVYGRAMSTMIEANLPKRKAAFKVLANCISLIDDNFSLEKENEQFKIITQISNDIFRFATTSYSTSPAFPLGTWKIETVALINTLSAEFMVTMEQIASKYPLSEKVKRIPYYTLALNHATTVVQRGIMVSPHFNEDVMKYHRFINEIDSNHIVPDKAPETIPAKIGGCYVATAVYGSYDCPEVWTLRRYRDFELASTWYGRAFVRTYYAISPTLVKWFGKTEWFKKMWRGKLDRMVSNLQEKGFDNSPYNDRKW